MRIGIKIRGKAIKAIPDIFKYKYILFFMVIIIEMMINNREKYKK